MRQIQEVQTWRQVRGLAGAVMCETRDLGTKWPHWHTLIFSDETRIDTKFVCPRDVKKMLVQRARSVYRKKWAAKHEYEEVKEGVWLEPAPALSRKKVREEWTEKHRNVARKIFLEGGGRKRDFSILACRTQFSVKLATWRKAQNSTGFTTVQNGMKSGGRKKEWKWQRGTVAHPPSESQWSRGHFSMTKWESEKHKSWGIPVEGFRGRVATDGSLLGKAGKWEIVVGQWYSWTMMKRWGPCMGPSHGMYGSMESEFEVQRTIKRAERPSHAFLTE